MLLLCFFSLRLMPLCRYADAIAAVIASADAVDFDAMEREAPHTLRRLRRCV